VRAIYVDLTGPSPSFPEGDVCRSRLTTAAGLANRLSRCFQVRLPEPREAPHFWRGVATRVQSDARCRSPTSRHAKRLNTPRLEDGTPGLQGVEPRAGPLSPRERSPSLSAHRLEAPAIRRGCGSSLALRSKMPRAATPTAHAAAQSHPGRDGHDRGAPWARMQFATGLPLPP
jgi:hypothetical protein